MSRIVVVGDSMLDRDVVGRVERLCPDAPAPVLRDCRWTERPGGAGLAAALLARSGHQVTLVTATADDDPGWALLARLEQARVEVHALRGLGSTAVRTRVRAGNSSIARLDDGSDALPPFGVDGGRLRDLLARADAVLVSDHGRGMTADVCIREVVAECPHRVWDPHPKGSPPLAGSTLVTPNLAEAAGFLGEPSAPTLAEASHQAARLVTLWAVAAVAITLGGRGSLLATVDGPPIVVPGRDVSPTDTCGAGDALASAAAAALAAGVTVSEAVARATGAASRYVAQGGASGLVVERTGARR